MLARSRQLSLRNSVEFSTPLLIPSISSLALAPVPLGSTPEGEPKLMHYSEIHSELLAPEVEESLLVSAYDIEHGLLTRVDAFKADFKQSDYARPRVLLIDSGGYEKQGIPPGSSFTGNAGGPLPWEKEDHVRVIDSLDPDAVPAVVNWDSTEPYAEQIQGARDFFDNRERLGSVFLLKSPEGCEFHNLQLLSAEDVAALGTFDIVGVTEREIGDSVHDRLVNIAKLRKSLDEAEVATPIHVFGGLDPLLTPLYFAAGAEIFDGLGWLRYAYREGVAMHLAAGGLLSGNVKERRRSAEITIWRQNLTEIGQLSTNMRTFAENGSNWDVFSNRSDYLRGVIESLQEELEV